MGQWQPCRPRSNAASDQGVPTLFTTFSTGTWIESKKYDTLNTKDIP